MLFLVVVAQEQEIERLARQCRHQLRLQPHEQVLVVGQERFIEADSCILTLRNEPVHVKLSSTAPEHVDGIVDNHQQPSNILQRACVEADLGLLADEDVAVTSDSGQRASADTNPSVYGIKCAFESLARQSKHRCVSKLTFAPLSQTRFELSCASSPGSRVSGVL